MIPCKNQFLQPDGFCTQCGKNHFQTRARRAPKKAEPKTGPRIRKSKVLIVSDPSDAEILAELFLLLKPLIPL